MCECFDNVCNCIYSVFESFVQCFSTVSFMYIYSYLFCLYWCKDCCNRVKSKLQYIIIIIIIIIIIEAVPGIHSIDSLQKTAILGTSHIIRKVLQCEA